ncbi:hypothetical protein ADICYQ_3590 [Cyclobacterium qasimii M12-11B]|uniref:Uncharacterized protein n=1 Tax=Cyclobacterium qasimii M12-11B TaxID=641524 RepID=S7WKZ2_9BACT|nr:hypothetical protein ADICYQ_3590 [Cyclobacterium qasimii M12-11B]
MQFHYLLKNLLKYQLKSGIYAEIKTVYGGFRNMKRWVNVLKYNTHEYTAI